MAVMPEPSSNFQWAARSESSAFAELVRNKPITKAKDTNNTNFLHIIILLTR
jgi:hypothetical protein